MRNFLVFIFICDIFSFINLNRARLSNNPLDPESAQILELADENEYVARKRLEFSEFERLRFEAFENSNLKDACYVRFQPYFERINFCIERGKL